MFSFFNDYRYSVSGVYDRSQIFNSNPLSVGLFGQIFSTDLPVSEEVITRLPRKILKHEKCTICIEEFDNSPAIVLPCNHAFHEDCIKGWFSVYTCH